MKYMLMMNCPRDGYEQFGSWPKKDIEAHIAFMIGFAKKLSSAGELVSAEGLGAPTQAKVVRAGKDGKPITDGVFPESKEFLAGYLIFNEGWMPCARIFSSARASNEPQSLFIARPRDGRRAFPREITC